MKFYSNLKHDIPASIVVFFVALPLCLGIALASGAPLFSGLIAGIVGGIVVGAISASTIGVSGPAAGLTAIVLSSITSLGGFENFLTAVCIAGIIQVIFGFLRAGIIGYYFPSSVIKGMLTGIGIIIILKQIPYFFGYHAHLDRNFDFIQVDGQNTFSEIISSLRYISPGTTIISVVSLLLLIYWDKVLSNKAKIFKIIQGPLVAVVFGITFHLLTKGHSFLGLEDELLVNVPTPKNMQSFFGQFTFPNLSIALNLNVLVAGFTIALVGSLETLLCVEATDKLDPEKNVTPTNRELIAQGVGNFFSGLIGGLPVTQVIVRSSANIQSGAKTKASVIIHGFLLLASVIAVPGLLNLIPLSVLSAILLIVGYKLAKPIIFIEMYELGWKQSLPFIVTVFGIIFTDLLLGITMGLAVGIIVILINSFNNSHFIDDLGVKDDRNHYIMKLAEEVTFFNKAIILKELNYLPTGAFLTLDITQTKFLDYDIIEILDDFSIKAKNKNIDIKLVSERGVIVNPSSFNKFFKTNPKPEKQRFCLADS